MKSDTVNISGVELVLSHPDKTKTEWIGSRETLNQLLACWLTVAEEDFALSPRIIGVPGIGKTTLAMSAARLRGQDLYIFQCTADTRPEDLLITPVLDSGGKISYHASPLVTAMIKGSICVLDEGNRMNEKSWASVAPLLDHRRYVESIIAGITIKAHPEFRCCTTMNEDESTFEIPDYILSRLNPTLEITFPEKEDELAILQYHLPFSDDELLLMTVDFLQTAHGLGLDYSPRDGINIVRYILKRIEQNKEHPAAKDKLWHEALVRVLGEDALDLKKLAEKKKMAAGDFYSQIGLEDIFFDDKFLDDKDDEK